jgi:hypothetical protein
MMNCISAVPVLLATRMGRDLFHRVLWPGPMFRSGLET